MTSSLNPVYYAFAIAVDGKTGQLAPWGGGVKHGQPAMEIALWILRTQKGTYAPDPDEGVDMTIVQTTTTNTAELWKSEVQRAFQKYVLAGVFRDLKVKAEHDFETGQIRYDVSFVDPRQSETLSTGWLVV